jgi:hypothetical protein
MKGVGRAGDNSSIVQGGAGGGPPGTGNWPSFPSSQAGPWLGPSQGSWKPLEETGAGL